MAMANLPMFCRNMTSCLKIISSSCVRSGGSEAHVKQLIRNFFPMAMTVQSRLLHSSVCRRGHNSYFIPAYPSDEPINDDEPRTEVIESKEDFKYVERLLPPMQIPPVPSHAQYPTPSGWSPPTGASPGTPYSVARTRYHSVPVFLETRKSNQHWTVIKHVKGDIWTLAEHLRSHLEEEVGRKVPVTVNEISRRIRYKGLYEDQVKCWLKERGF